ncbi:ribosomal protein S19 family protein [Candidatus Woesearchaeota archaeon]|nr:ribosomal protein S19 family protein [Candidatus Woesearchaeota archaeon]
MVVKIFKFHGKTADEVKNLSEDEFLKLIPSRSRRSILRGLSDEQQAFMRKLEKGKDNIETHLRDLVVVPKMIGKTIKIHNGKEFVPVLILPDHLGYFFGELALTRKKANHSKTGVGSKKKVSIRK